MTPIEEAQKAVREWDEGNHCHWDSRAYVDVIRGLLGTVPMMKITRPQHVWRQPDDVPAKVWKLDPAFVQDVYANKGVIYVRMNNYLYYLEDKKLYLVAP